MKILSVEEIKAIVGERYSYFQFSKEKIELLAAKDVYEFVWEDGATIVQALYPDNLICSGIFDHFLVFDCHNGLRKDPPSVAYRNLDDKKLVEKIFTFFEQENIKYHPSWLKLKERFNDESKKHELIQVSLTNSGAYFIYSVPNVKRGIRGKTRGHADEVIIHGIPKNKLQDFCIKNEIQITNLAVYQYGEKILINIPGSTNYNKTGE